MALSLFRNFSAQSNNINTDTGKILNKNEYQIYNDITINEQVLIDLLTESNTLTSCKKFNEDNNFTEEDNNVNIDETEYSLSNYSNKLSKLSSDSLIYIKTGIDSENRITGSGLSLLFYKTLINDLDKRKNQYSYDDICGIFALNTPMLLSIMYLYAITNKLTFEDIIKISIGNVFNLKDYILSKLVVETSTSNDINYGIFNYLITPISSYKINSLLFANESESIKYKNKNGTYYLENSALQSFVNNKTLNVPNNRYLANWQAKQYKTITITDKYIKQEWSTANKTASHVFETSFGGYYTLACKNFQSGASETYIGENLIKIFFNTYMPGKTIEDYSIKTNYKKFLWMDTSKTTAIYTVKYSYTETNSQTLKLKHKNTNFIIPLKYMNIFAYPNTVSSTIQLKNLLIDYFSLMITYNKSLYNSTTYSSYPYNDYFYWAGTYFDPTYNTDTSSMTYDGLKSSTNTLFNMSTPKPEYGAVYNENGSYDELRSLSYEGPMKWRLQTFIQKCVNGSIDIESNTSGDYNLTRYDTDNKYANCYNIIIIQTTIPECSSRTYINKLVKQIVYYINNTYVSRWVIPAVSTNSVYNYKNYIFKYNKDDNSYYINSIDTSPRKFYYNNNTKLTFLEYFKKRVQASTYLSEYVTPGSLTMKSNIKLAYSELLSILNDAGDIAYDKIPGSNTLDLINMLALLCTIENYFLWLVNDSDTNTGTFKNKFVGINASFIDSVEYNDSAVSSSFTTLFTQIARFTTVIQRWVNRSAWINNIGLFDKDNFDNDSYNNFVSDNQDVADIINAFYDTITSNLKVS